MTAETSARLRPLLAALDLEGAVPYDGRDALNSYVVSTPDHRHLRLTATGLFLLRAARDGLPVAAVTARLAQQAGQAMPESSVEAAYGSLAAQIEGMLGRKAPSRAGMWGAVPLLPERLVIRSAQLLIGAYRRPVAVAALTVSACAIVLAAALHGLHGVHGGDVLAGYLLFLVVLLAHELGHASAALHGGARPRRIGFVIYLVWPAFFSDVTESWRLCRRSRLMVDIGGVYFQAIATGLAAACYAATDWRPLAVTILFSLAGCLANLNPFFRFDGYWLVGDALGVDSLHRRGREALTGLLRRRERVPDGALCYLLAGYTLIAWSTWLLFALWLAIGAYRRVLSLPALLRSILSGSASGSVYWHFALSAALLVMTAIVTVRAGRLAVAGAGSVLRRMTRTALGEREA